MFPNYKKFLGIFNVKDDWKDKGTEPQGWNLTYYPIKHIGCGEEIRKGIDTPSGNVFFFCPRCMKKVTSAETRR